MRLIKLTVPESLEKDIAEIAYAAGIRSITVHKVLRVSAAGSESCSAIEIQTSTPAAKSFEDSLLDADFFDPGLIQFSVRQGRSIVSDEEAASITRPLVEPSTDLMQELWQFSHLTFGLAGRLLIASGRLARGLIRSDILLMIAGLLFLPLLPLLLAIGFGALSRQPKLVLQAVVTFVASIFLLVAGGMIVAFLSDPPVLYTGFESLPVSLLVSTVVGIAAGLATLDDSGRRELIGLAAAAQVGIAPVWLGCVAVLGVPQTLPTHYTETRIVLLAMNIASIIIAASSVYWVTGMSHRRLGKIK